MEIDAVTLEQTVSRCATAVHTGESLVVGVLNAAKLVKVQRDAGLRSAIEGCDVNIADGMALVWAGRILGQPLQERVTGIDLFFTLLQEADREGWSVYLLGATEEVLGQVVSRVRRELPGVRIAGARNGYFDADDEPAIADAIRESGADLLFVGISTPKKELFLQRWGRKLGVSVCHGVGGGFDVFAGLVERAPDIWQRLGLEWLYRVKQEPLRLCKRYLTTNVAFIYLVMREKLFGTRKL